MQTAAQTVRGWADILLACTVYVSNKFSVSLQVETSWHMPKNPSGFIEKPAINLIQFLFLVPLIMRY